MRFVLLKLDKKLFWQWNHLFLRLIYRMRVERARATWNLFAHVHVSTRLFTMVLFTDPAQMSKTGREAGLILYGLIYIVLLLARTKITRAAARLQESSKHYQPCCAMRKSL
jgi:hypothetical protein